MQKILMLNLQIVIMMCFSCLFGFLCSYAQLGQYNSFTYSSSSYAQSELGPYHWRYIRVDLPQGFSSVSIAFQSNVDVVWDSPGPVLKNTMPILCLRDGSPPIPDISDSSLESLVLYPLSNLTSGGMQNLQLLEKCFPVQKNMSLQLTNEQVSPGAWYFGLFNVLGPTRTQSRMISRGPSYSFSANISVDECSTSTISGQYCNQTVNFVSCTQYNYLNSNASLSKQNVLSCKNSLQDSCHSDGEPILYALDMLSIAEQLTITATNVRFDATNSNDKTNVSEISLMCYARHDAIPFSASHDYSGDLNKAPLFIPSPKVGRWYVTIVPSNVSKQFGDVNNQSMKACYSMEWKVLQCPLGKAGLNCSLEKYSLQAVRRNPFSIFESYYLPQSTKVSSTSGNFPLGPLLSNSSFGHGIESAWTYFLLDIPYGAAGGNIHIRLALAPDLNKKYEIYARYGALPTLDEWDYFYANRSHNSNRTTYFKIYDNIEGVVSFYLFYPKEGMWSFGLRKLEVASDSSSVDQSTMSISLERCPSKCSSRGYCINSFEESGLTAYSFCQCDLDNGGFDCSVGIVTHKGRIWQIILLIGSNSAAILPAFWALRQKAYAEWILFTCSGISSALYHACDLRAWCALPYNVLQFFDFWLSFVAVVSTFIYLASIDEGAKRTIHTVVYILTALMAASGPTRSANIVLTLSIGVFCLFIGWMMEFYRTHGSFSLSTAFSVSASDRWQTMKGWLGNLVKIVLTRFRWGFLLAGTVAFALAATTWKVVTGENYWICHSVWHVSIYTSSFFFLCSKVNAENGEIQAAPDGRVYELTRQDSSSRVV